MLSLMITFGAMGWMPPYCRLFSMPRRRQPLLP